MNYKKLAIILMAIYIILSPVFFIIIADKVYDKGIWDGIYLANKNRDTEQTIINQNHEIELKQTAYKEYDRGFIDAIDSCRSNILFAGSTFKYGEYFIKAQDIQLGKVEIEVIQAGNYIFNGTCYADKWCNIKDVSFQIDDIHIGKEAAYLVYWSDK